MDFGRAGRSPFLAQLYPSRSESIPFSAVRGNLSRHARSGTILFSPRSHDYGSALALSRLGGGGVGIVAEGGHVAGELEVLHVLESVFL